ncbi:MAG: hypothetical protein MUO99_06425, partial [Dehalococcoidales bacterium]|nr:hypothetical protein [Dehalococcoidales bacterium]
SHSVLDTRFLDNLWREPVPFNLSSQYGLAIAHYGSYCWLSAPGGVWRAPLTVPSLDLTNDIILLRQENALGQGRLTIELRNDDGRYASLPSPLGPGCQLEVSPGYVTSAGNEASPGPTFALEAYEHTSSGGKASLILYSWDGWGQINTWVARHQFRWNKTTNEMSVKDMLAFILARVGFKLEVKSQSSVITSYYPDFVIHPGDRGDALINRLLSFVPDVLFMEGNRAYLVNPQSTDSSVYSYGAAHPILEGRYREEAWALSRIRVEGYDTAGGQPIIVDGFDWSQIVKLGDRLSLVADRNIDTVTEAEQRGQAHLRESEIESAGGNILVPVHCGQQLYDVIDITDSRAEVSAKKKRVLGLTLIYQPAKGEYQHRLTLGAV